MKLRRIRLGSDYHLELLTSNGWVSVGKAVEHLAPSSGNSTARWDRDVVALLGAPPDVRDPEKVFGQEGKLRAEFATATKAFTTVRDSYARIQASAEDPSAAGDLALIFNYMKVLDPGSTVREGEFATAQNAAGVPERVQAFYNNVMRGERMTPVQRDDFVDRSGRLYESQLSQYKNTETRYRDLASKYQGVDPERVVYDVTGGLTVPAPPATDVTDLPEGDIKETKTIGGKTYVRIGDDWFEQ